jgi:hypothetical protein
MNPLTHFKKIRIVPLLIAPALAVLTALSPVSARATPSCGLTSTNLLSPVPAGYFPSGLLNLMCTSNLPDWLLITRRARRQKLSPSKLFRTARRDGLMQLIQVAQKSLLAPHSEARATA